jgi:hypothetical protein
MANSPDDMSGQALRQDPMRSDGAFGYALAQQYNPGESPAELYAASTRHYFTEAMYVVIAVSSASFGGTSHCAGE